MPLAVKGGNVIFHDGTIAGATLGGEHVEVVVTTVGFSFTLMETVLSELLAALGAEEVVHVPSFLQGCNAFIQNRSVAVSASGAEQIVIVGLAVRLALPLEEVPGAQFLGAMGAGEMLRMPRLAQGGDDLAYDGFFAGAAASLLAGVYSLTAHVCIKVI